MEQWWQNFIEGIAELPAYTWALLGLIVLAGIAFYLLNRSGKVGKGALIGVLCVAVIAMIGVLILAIPEPEIEEGASTAASWLYTPLFWCIVVSLVGILALVALLRKQVWTTKLLATGAMCVALAFVLSCITVYRMPNGGSITPASMLPIILFAWIYGPVPGIAAGMMDGVIQLIQGVYVVHPFQFLLDYILPFAVLGVAGFFKKEKQLPLAVIVAVVCRYIIHVLSGWLYFGAYAPEGMHPLIYSLGYNATYLGPELVICLIIVLIPAIHHAFQRIRKEALA